MPFRYIFLALVVIVTVACSDKIDDNFTPDNNKKCYDGTENCIEISISNPNTQSGVNPKDVDPGTLAPNEVFNSFDDGAVVPFHWQNTLPWYYEASDYPYGFDKDPMSNWIEHIETSKDVYVSTATGELARVILKVPPEFEMKDLSLVDESGNAVCNGGSCVGEISLNAGTYTLVYKGVDQQRYVHVIEYEKKESPYEITYVQFNNEDGTSCSVEEGCYTKESAEQRFNEIFAQVVTAGSFTKVAPSALGLSNLYEVDLTEPYDESAISNLAKSILNQHPLVKSNSVQLREKGARYVLALNNVRIVWRLEKQISSSNMTLNNGFDFWSAYVYSNKINVLQNADAPIYIKSLPGCSDGVGSNPVEVFARAHSYNEEVNTMTISLRDASGNAVAFSPTCDYIYVDTYGFIPGISGAAQITYSLVKGVGNADGSIEPFMAGGVSFAARQVGDASQNTLVHELGHTFGLLDLYINEKDPSVPNCLVKDAYGNYTLLGSEVLQDGSIRNYFNARKCDFATDEADMMNYQIPAGPRLRYRPMEYVVKTGENDPSGKYESQWECIRNGKCARFENIEWE